MADNNFSIGAGDGLVVEIEVFDENGDPQDITGWTILFTAKRSLSQSDDDAYISKDITSHTTPASGKSLLQVPKGETTEPGVYYWNTRYLDEVGDEYPESTENGTLNIENRATKRTS